MRSHLAGVLTTCFVIGALCAAGDEPSRAAAAAAPSLLAQAAPTMPPPTAPPPAPPPTMAPPGSTAVVAPPPEAQGPSVARVRFSGGEVAAGIGFSWGDGTIDYRGRQHRFHISGLSIANVGITSMSAAGEVYNLHRLADFAGNYVEVAAGATVGGGATVAYLRNAHGVVIKVTATTRGLDFQLSSNGVKISLG